MYLECSALRNQIVQVPVDLVAKHKIVKRGNPFCIPQIKNFPVLQLSFYLGQSSFFEEPEEMEHSLAKATPLNRCCDACPSSMVYYRTYGFQFDAEGKAQVPLMIQCAPTHDRRRHRKILLQVKIGKRASKVMKLKFKTGKRPRKEEKPSLTDTQGAMKIQAILHLNVL